MKIHFPQKRDELLSLLSLAILTIIACMVRFGFQYPDSQYYMELVEFFRGEISRSELNSPFSFRPLLPLIAAFLPFSPETTISFLNLVFLVLLSWVLFVIALEFDTSLFIAFLASAVYSFSWVVMYYGAVVLVDPGSILCLSLAMLMIVRDEKSWKIASVLLLGVLFKETAIIGVVSYLLMKRKLSHVVVGLPPLGYAVIRLATPVSNPSYFWKFHLRIFTDLLESTAKTLGLTLLPYLALIVIGLLLGSKANAKNQRSIRYLISAGLPAVAFMFVGLFFAHFDARFVWPLYPALIPITGNALESLKHSIMKHI